MAYRGGKKGSGLRGALEQPVQGLPAGEVKLRLQVDHLADHVHDLLLAGSVLRQERHLEDGEQPEENFKCLGRSARAQSVSPRELLGSHIAGGEDLLDLGNELSLALLVHQLCRAGLHLGVDEPDGSLPHHLLPSVDLAKYPDDGSLGVPPDERHDAVLDDGDLPLVLRLQELHQNIHNLGQVLDVLIFAQYWQIFNGLEN